MYQDKPAWIEHQRKRFMRPNAHLFIRHDAYRFMPPGSPRWVGKDVVRYCWPDPRYHQPSQADERKAQHDLAGERDELLCMQSELAAIKAELKFLRLLRLFKAYNPSQPRVPAGTSDGGQWTADGGRQGTAENGQADRIRVAQLGGTVTDPDGRPYYRPGGHHEMPEGVYKKWNLDPETAKVFRQSSTGPLGATFRTTPDGPRIGNVWDGEGGLHRAYNDAVTELSQRFIERNGLRPDGANMTADHARAILKEIRESEDPRIRDFNLNMRRMQRFRRLRGVED
ncbi:MAG: hypothetical protein QOI12_4630 [Alphaproteobacteria bacterium]|jgi:hypothetical protein|nr:hypothetical protein [Alphaproteobacteria bacterium]